MNKKSTPFLAIFFFFCAAFPAFTDGAITIDGISFNVSKVSSGAWSKPRHHMVNDMVDHVDKENEALSYVAITFTLTNNNETRKIDLDGKITYALFDEYGNRYRAMRKPEDFKGSVLTVAKNFPSLYPGERYGETLFFEAPVATAKILKLIITPESFKLSKPVELIFSPNGSPVPAATPAQAGKQPDPAGLTAVKMLPPITENAGITVVSPKPGVVWDQGQATRILVAVPQGQVPKRIIVIVLDNTFQDNKPVKDNVYDINVPLDQAPGAYMINIIAQWPNNDITSMSLPFYVKDATPLGIL